MLISAVWCRPRAVDFGRSPAGLRCTSRMRARSCSRAVRSRMSSVALTLGSSWVGPSPGRHRDAVDLLPARARVPPGWRGRRGARGTGTAMAEGGDMIELRTPGELDAMRAAGAVVADMLAAVRAAAAP